MVSTLSSYGTSETAGVIDHVHVGTASSMRASVCIATASGWTSVNSHMTVRTVI